MIKILRYAPALLLLGLIPLACSEAPITIDASPAPVACDELADCYSNGNYELGTDCRNNQCLCPEWEGPSRMCPVPCCLRGADPFNCKRQCRPIEECAPEQCTGSTGDPTASSSGGGGEGIGGNGQGGSGGATVPGCDTAADCTEKPADARCGEVECINGECRLTLRPIEKINSQLQGDCVSTYCDGQGATIVLPDGEDNYNDGKECTIDSCENQQWQNILLPNGTPCPETGIGVCFDGNCVECMTGIAEVCGNGFACDAVYCVPLMCFQSKNGSVDSGLESGVDCGGQCHPCFNPQTCNQPSDCFDGVCFGGMCSLPTHSDGVQNDQETGTDCGCLNCALCPDDFGCETGDNCKSGICWGGKCQAPACNDGRENGDETGVDCGVACNISCPK